MKFTENELILLQIACMKYGETLAETARNLSDEKNISDIIADRAKEAFNLMRKISTLIEEVSEEA